LERPAAWRDTDERPKDWEGCESRGNYGASGPPSEEILNGPRGWRKRVQTVSCQVREGKRQPATSHARLLVKERIRSPRSRRNRSCQVLEEGSTRPSGTDAFGGQTSYDSKGKKIHSRGKEGIGDRDALQDKSYHPTERMKWKGGHRSHHCWEGGSLTGDFFCNLLSRGWESWRGK